LLKTLKNDLKIIRKFGNLPKKVAFELNILELAVEIKNWDIT
jgi:hypothetical protein